MEYYSIVNKPKEYKSWDSISKYSKFVAEPKYDGIRMLAEKKNGEITIHREDHNIKNVQFPEVIKALENMPDNTVYDGELCVLDKTTSDELSLRAEFSSMQSRHLVKDPLTIKLRSEALPATFVCFDVLKYQGLDVRAETLTKRRSLIRNVVKIQQYSPESLLQRVDVNDMEGIVVKDPLGKYGKEWFKFKNYVEKKYKVIGINSLEHNISSLELAEINDTESVGAVNWQFYKPEQQTDIVKEALIGKVVDVRHMSRKKNEKLRFPSLQKKDMILKVIAQ